VVLAYTSLEATGGVLTDMFSSCFFFDRVHADGAVTSMGRLQHTLSRTHRKDSSTPWLESTAGCSNRLHSFSKRPATTIFGNAQRYFCADTEQSAKRIAILWHDLFTIRQRHLLPTAVDCGASLAELGT